MWEKISEILVIGKAHTYKTAIQYMNVWAHFVSWSCDFDCLTKMTLEDVNALLTKTEERLRPMFQKVKNDQNGELGIRNFMTVQNKLQGSVDEKLDQVLIEYRHIMATTHQNTNRNKIIIVLGIPGRFNDTKENRVITLTKETMKNEHLEFNIPTYGGLYNKNELSDIRWNGTLDKPIMR